MQQRATCPHTASFSAALDRGFQASVLTGQSLCFREHRVLAILLSSITVRG